MFANEMVLNIYVFRTLVEFRCHGKSNCSSIVEKDPDGVSGMKDPDNTGARRVMRSSGRLTRTIALVKSKYKTRMISALLQLVSYEG